MWFDTVEKIINSKTFIIALHDGSRLANAKFGAMEANLIQANISNVRLISLKSIIGSRLAQTYGAANGGLFIVRPNKELAWFWLGHDMPLLNELIYRFKQVG